MGVGLLVLGFFPNSSQAQYQEEMEFFPVTCDTLNINIDIDQKGYAKVVESFNVIQFGTGYFSFVIPKDISQLRVFRGRTPYKDYDIKKSGNLMILENLGPSSSSWQIEYLIKNAIVAKKDFDEFRFEVAPQGNYINRLNINLKIPQNSQAQTKFEAIHYAIHGINNAQGQVIDSSNFSYSGETLGPYSSFTAVAHLPKGIIDFTFIRRFENLISNLSGLSWVIFSILLPFATFIFMLLMIYKKNLEENIKPAEEQITAPPDNISPAAAGVLFRGGLSHREIAATIIDLAVRGYLFIVYGGLREGYRFGERRSFLTLAPHERDLGKELLRGGLRRSLKEIQEEPQAEIFSATVSKIYQDIYQDIARLGYFIENPEVVHRRYYFAGIAIFVVSIIGFIIAAFSLPYPPYLLFGFVAMAISSLVVMKMSTAMPFRTAKGQQALSRWLAFRRHLIEFQKPGYYEIVGDTYFKWLPYAVVFGVEKKWASHFVKVPFKNPEWYAAFQDFNSIPEFTYNFYVLIDYIADIMESLREPTIK